MGDFKVSSKCDQLDLPWEIWRNNFSFDRDGKPRGDNSRIQGGYAF